MIAACSQYAPAGRLFSLQMRLCASPKIAGELAPLLNSDISDIECMQTLVKIEGLEDDEFLQFVCNNEHAMQTIRNKAFGVTCSTDTMPIDRELKWLEGRMKSGRNANLANVVGFLSS